MMPLDDHNACPACPQIVRALYAVGRRVLIREQDGPEYEDLYVALEALRPWVEAHHANQVHAFSAELESARQPALEASAAAAATEGADA